MSAYISKIKKIILSLIERGFFHIFIGNTLVKCIGFASAIFLPRLIVPESSYGLLTSVDNINHYLILANGIGLTSTLLRYGSMKETREERSAIFAFCLKWGLLFNAVLLLVTVPLVLFSPAFTTGNYGAAKYYILAACLIPTLTYLLDVAMVFMRCNILNKMFSRASVIYTSCYAGCQIILAWLLSLNGVIIGRYIAFSVVLFICYAMLLRNKIYVKHNISITHNEKKAFILFGIGAMLTNALSLILPLNETLIVNLVLKDLTTTAYYKAASLIPSNLQFIATSVAVFVFPYFAKRTGDGEWIWKKTKELFVGMCAIILPIITVCYFISPQIILLVYGKSYAPAISIMRPMWIAFGINTIIRIPIGNTLGALGEIRFNLILSIFICLIHFILDYLFISKMGIEGAAYALMISYGVSGIISAIYMCIMCKTKWKKKAEDKI